MEKQNITLSIPKDLLQKVIRPIPPEKARKNIEFLTTWDVVPNDKDLTLRAIDLQEKVRFSFWDSLVVQAAIQSQARLLLSEDLPDGQEIHGLEIANPFNQNGLEYL